VSNVSDTTQTSTPDWQNPHDPKASAKAAKAYAKATRPWYKKKRFVVPIALVVLAMVGSGLGGEEAGPTVTETANAEAPAGAKDKSGKPDDSNDSAGAEQGSQESPAKIGQAVELEGTRYTVTNVKTSDSLGSSFMKEKADGIFVVVNMTIENLKDESKIFVDSAAEFAASDGTTYTTDSDAAFIADDTLILTEMHPDLPTKGTLIFDVPSSKLKGGQLAVSDLFGGGEAFIDLGL
jgi:hypothetical protein